MELETTRAQLAASIDELESANVQLATADAKLTGTNAKLLRISGELQRSRKALRDYEGRLRGILDNTAVGIVEVDPDDRFLTINNRALQILGYRREELLARTVHDITHPDDRPESGDPDARIRDGASALDYERRYLRADGTAVWVHVAVSAVRDLQGRWVRSVLTIEPITERKRAADAPREGERRRSGMEASRATASVRGD